MKKKVIAAGHICLDITPAFQMESQSGTGQVFVPGRLIETGKADIHTGGAVANTGLAMKILGADVTLMGKIGDDAFGNMVMNILSEYDADSGMIISKEESTSYSIVLAVPGIDRIFLHNPGANHTFRASDIPEEALEDTALFHFGYPPLMRSMYENDGSELIGLMKRMKSHDIATSLDMSAVDESSDAGKADWEKILERVIPCVDFFVPSAEELCFMLDKERFADWKGRARDRDVTEILDIEKDIRPLADQCMAFGAKVLLIKCGAAGMYYRTADRMHLLGVGGRIGLNVGEWAQKEGFEESYVPERVLSGTGAGDTSIAAFLTAVLEGCSLEAAMSLAAAEGASCVAAYDALSGLKSLAELEKKISGGWEKRRIK